MKQLCLLLWSAVLFVNCTNYGQLKVLTNLPEVLEEASGVQLINGSSLLWMHNDSGNKSIIYGVDTKGKIIRKLKVNAKNHDWEDITSDTEGNLYVADFGNNGNKRKNLSLLKVSYTDVLEKEEVEIEKIKFSYPDQTKYPPKKKIRYFDAESLFYKNGFLYVFTKSRVEDNYGRTSLYRIPATKGNHVATYISTYESDCNASDCWFTSAAISPDGKKVVLLNQKSVLVFTDFIGDDFLKGTVKEYPFGHTSQKEGVCFKDNNTLYITDERAHGEGGKLYEFSLN